MTAFLDSSALVKRYCDEPGASVVRSLEGPLVVGSLARIEVVSALWRKHRLGELEAGLLAVLLAEFENDWLAGPSEPSVFLIVSLDDRQIEVAVRHVAIHGLRAADATQLAAACFVRDLDPDDTLFVAYDRRLRSAAAAEGFALVPV